MDPGKTLNNARQQGLLDRTERGYFSVNAVGENLVAMTLPGDSNSGGKRAKKKTAKKKTAKKKTARKKTARKKAARKA